MAPTVRKLVQRCAHPYATPTSRHMNLQARSPSHLLAPYHSPTDSMRAIAAVLIVARDSSTADGLIGTALRGRRTLPELVCSPCARDFLTPPPNPTYADKRSQALCPVKIRVYAAASWVAGATSVSTRVMSTTLDSNRSL